MVWDYGQYQESLKSASTDYNAALGELGGSDAQKAQNIYKEILAQQQAGSDQYWYKGNTASNQAAAADVALRLAENGVGSLAEVGQRNVKTYVDGYNSSEEVEVPEYFNKSTGEALPRQDLFGPSSGRSNLDIVYNLHFTQDGYVIPYTSNRTSEWVTFREEVAKPVAAMVLAAYGVPYVSAALGGTAAGASLVAAGGQAALTGVSAGLVSGGVSLLSGNDFEESLKAALVSGATAAATAGYADKIGQSLGFDAGSVASKAAGNAIIAGAKAGVTDQNILAEMAKSAVTTYMSNKDGVIKAADEDLAAGLDPRYGSNQTYDAFMTESMTPEARASIETQIDPSQMGPQTAEKLSTGFESYLNESTFDATATQGSLAKEVKEPGSGLSAKDIKTGIKIAGVFLAGNEVVNPILDSGLGSRPSSSSSVDKYRNAPIAGFKMVKYDDPTSGGSKYIPFIGEEALLPPPEGYERKYAKGGFVSKPTKRNGLAARR